jgi:hypothetical protein
MVSSCAVDDDHCARFGGFWYPDFIEYLVAKTLLQDAVEWLPDPP